MRHADVSLTTASKPAHRIGGSFLPSCDIQILQPVHGAHGKLQVRPLPELDTFGLFLDDTVLLVTHPNGYSCHELATRMVAAWKDASTLYRAMAQFDYILSCGGLGKQRESIEFIAQGSPSH